VKYYEVTFNITAPTGSMTDARDLVAALTGEIGFETFEETNEGLKGYVQTQLFDPVALDEALQDFPIAEANIGYDIHEAEYKDWNEEWEKEGFNPITVGKDCIIHDGRHFPKGHARVEVEIDAKLAFGTGNHETTCMMVSLLMNMDIHGKTMLDAGCGTGILGIVALKHGATHVTGYDIDEWCVDNTRHNAIINHVDDMYEALLGDASVLDNIGKTFDVVVANINRNILLADMPRFISILNNDGMLLLSGFYTDDEEMLKSKAEKLGLAFDSEKSDKGWVCLTFRKTR